MKFKDNKYPDLYLFADFETYGLSYYLKNGYTKVYASYLRSIDLGIEIFDVDLDNFIKKIKEKIKNDYQMRNKSHNYMIYFHNGSGFDFHFLLSKLYDHFPKNNISSFWFKNKDIYYIKIKVKSQRKVIYYITFACSYLIFRTSIDKMGKSLGMEKIENYDYDMTDIFEKNDDYIKHKNGLSYNYLKRDVEILENFFFTDKGLNYDYFRLTNGSTAMKFLYEINPELADQTKWLRKKGDVFYTIDLWNNLKLAHNGGFCYVNPKYQLKHLKNVRVYDVNSLYAAVMKFKKIPYGYPSFYKQKDYDYEFYFVEIDEVKTDKIPYFADSNRVEDYIRLKEKYLQKKHSEKNKDVDLLIPSEDIFDEKYSQTLRKQTILMDKYQLEYFEKNYKGKYKKRFYVSFKEKSGMFDEYIKHWEKLKIDFEKAGNKVGRQFAKEQAILPNGKFGQTIYNKKTDIFEIEKIKEELNRLKNKNPDFNFIYRKTDKGEYIIQSFKDTNEEYSRASLKRIGHLYHYSLFYEVNTSPNFLPIAISILSQARRLLFEQINLKQDKFIYADTDSIHILDDSLEDKFIDPFIFGYFKFEGLFENAVYRRPKHYLHTGLLDHPEKNLISKDFYELKGGGFNVSYFNATKKISLKDYLQEEFEVEGGKRTKINLASGIVLAETNYKFTMPKFYYDYKQKKEKQIN